MSVDWCPSIAGTKDASSSGCSPSSFTPFIGPTHTAVSCFCSQQLSSFKRVNNMPRSQHRGGPDIFLDFNQCQQTRPTTHPPQLPPSPKPIKFKHFALKLNSSDTRRLLVCRHGRKVICHPFHLVSLEVRAAESSTDVRPWIGTDASGDPVCHDEFQSEWNPTERTNQSRTSDFYRPNICCRFLSANWPFQIAPLWPSGQQNLNYSKQFDRKFAFLASAKFQIRSIFFKNSAQNGGTGHS